MKRQLLIPRDPRTAPIVNLREVMPLIRDKPDEEALAEARLCAKLDKPK